VDGSGRAFVRIRLKNPTDATEVELDAWIDTRLMPPRVVWVEIEKWRTVSQTIIH